MPTNSEVIKLLLKFQIPKNQLTTIFALSILGVAFLSAQTIHAQYKATTAEERLKDREKRLEMEKKSLLFTVKFRNVGPTQMSGRVVDIDVNPCDPTEFYVAFATGGLWHTVNNGLSFLPIFDNNEHIFIGDIAVNWQTRTIWVGTGEANSSRSSYAGTGIYKSHDNGTSWIHLGLPESHHIGKIALHPTDTNTVWVAAMGHLYSFNKERGVFMTTDGGKTWKHTLYINDKTGAIDLEVDPQNPNTVYAAMWYRTRSAWNFEESGKTSGIYKSIDGGINWQLISTPGSGFITGEGVGRIGLALFPKNPQILYAVADNQFKKKIENNEDSVYLKKLTIADFKTITKEQFAALDTAQLNLLLKKYFIPERYKAEEIKVKVAEGFYKPTVLYDYLHNPNDVLDDDSTVIGCQVFRSNDGGISWKQTNKKDMDSAMYYTYGYYFGKIWVSPTNPNKVVITGVGLMQSTDGGESFTRIDGKNVHSDHHSIWMNPKKDGHIINGNDGGLNITYDNGKVWFKANSIPVGQFYAIETDDAKPYNVYGGLQDNGAWYGPSVQKEDSEWFISPSDGFTFLNGGDGMMVQADTRDNSTVYSGAQFGYYLRSVKNRDQRKLIKARQELGEKPLRFNWETPILLSRHNQDIFYLGTNRFHRSMNKADTLLNLSGDLTKGLKTGDVPYGTLTCIAESPLKFGLLYTGSDDGLLHISKDGGYTWTRIGLKLPPDLWITCITPSQFKEGRVYVSMSGYRYDHFSPYLFVSNDYGASFTPITGNLPLEAVNAIKEDHKMEQIIYVATDQGLYASIDKGINYMPFAGGLPRVPVHDITIQKRENELVVGTHGRSIYIAKLDAVQKLVSEKK
jgi:photosystem II stability/assembly factor-like uncharacterized protein